MRNELEVNMMMMKKDMESVINVKDEMIIDLENTVHQLITM